jgi:hypothetical protein
VNRGTASASRSGVADGRPGGFSRVAVVSGAKTPEAAAGPSRACVPVGSKANALDNGAGVNATRASVSATRRKSVLVSSLGPASRTTRTTPTAMPQTTASSDTAQVGLRIAA